MSQVMPYEAWRITYQSSEQAARAAYEAMVELQERATAISEADRLELTCALGLLRGLKYNGSADALERVLRGAGSLAAVQQENLGETCMDGGKCHHDCKSKCFRRECCVPLSTAMDAGLTMEQWRYPASHPTQQGLDALTDALTDCRRELQSCQSVIHMAGGFDPRYVSDAKAAIKKADAALAAKAKQGEQA